MKEEKYDKENSRSYERKKYKLDKISEVRVDSMRRAIKLIKLNEQKAVAFPHTNNEQFNKEIKKIISFTIAPKIIKYLGINLTKEMKDLYTENYKTMLKH